MSFAKFQRCPLCHLQVDPEQLQTHNCLQTLGGRLDRHRQDLDFLRSRLRGVTDEKIMSKFNELEKRLEHVEGEQRGDAEVLKDIQHQLDEIRAGLRKAREESLKGRSEAEKTFFRLDREAPPPTPQEMELEEGEIPSQSSDELPPNEPQPGTSGTNKQTFSNRLTSGSSPTDKVRKVVRQEGARMTFGPGLTYEPKKATFAISVSKKPTECSTADTDQQPVDRQFKITSNNLSTQNRAPKEQIEVVIERANNQPQSIWVNKTTTAEQLHVIVRQQLGLSSNEKITILHTQHQAVPFTRDRTLWALGFRHIPNHVAIVADDIHRGDQVELIYQGKGKNVNGGYVRFDQR